MLLELDEVQELLDGGRGEAVDRDKLESTIQALMFHQCLYDDTPGLPKHIVPLLRKKRSFFERYFSPMGYKMIVDHREQLIVLSQVGVGYGWKQTRLKKDETLVLLALRLLIDEGLRSGNMNELGRVETTTDDIFDLIRTLGKTEPPTETRLDEILKFLRRKGAVRIGDRDRGERVTEVTILPGIRYHVPDAYIEGIILWIERGAPEEEDIFDFLARQRAEPAAPAAEAASDAEADADTDTGVDADADTSAAPAAFRTTAGGIDDIEGAL